MADRPADRLGLAGKMSWGAHDIRPDDVVLGSPGVPEVTRELPELPMDSTARELADTWSRRRPSRVVVKGAGSAFDVVRRALDYAGAPVPLVFVPAGAEPWRAFAPFGSLYDDGGDRKSGPWLVSNEPRIVLDDRVWSEVPADARQLGRADSAVHAIEVLLSRASSVWSRELAAGALRVLARDTDATVESVAAAGLAVHAFASTGLGAAHALASPIGLLHSRTHDLANVILGPGMVRWWGDSVDWLTIADAIGVEPKPKAIANWLEGLQRLSHVPTGLTQAGFDRSRGPAVLERAMKSSGVPWFPERRDRDDVARLLESVW